jgi:hypothetical protein
VSLPQYASLSRSSVVAVLGQAGTQITVKAHSLALLCWRGVDQVCRRSSNSLSEKNQRISSSSWRWKSRTASYERDDGCTTHLRHFPRPRNPRSARRLKYVAPLSRRTACRRAFSPVLQFASALTQDDQATTQSQLSEEGVLSFIK